MLVVNHSYHLFSHLIGFLIFPEFLQWNVTVLLQVLGWNLTLLQDEGGKGSTVPGSLSPPPSLKEVLLAKQISCLWFLMMTLMLLLICLPLRIKLSLLCCLWGKSLLLFILSHYLLLSPNKQSAKIRFRVCKQASVPSLLLPYGTQEKMWSRESWKCSMGNTEINIYIIWPLY